MRGFMKKHKIICIVTVFAFILILALSFIVRARLFSSKDRGSPPATQTDAVSDADSQNVIADADSDSSDTGDSDMDNKKDEDVNDSDSLVSVSSNLDKDDSGSSEQSNSNNDSNNSGSSGNGNSGNSGSGNTGNSGNTGSGSNSGSGSGSSVSGSGSGSGNNSGTSSGGNNSGSGSGSNSGSGSSVSGSGSGSDSSTTESSSVSCNHSWKKVTKTVHHDEVGHWEDVVVQDAWDEQVLDYGANVCNSCGVVMKDWNIEQILLHTSGCNGGTGYHYQKFYHTVHHDAVTERQWVVDIPAYDEYGVFDHYECTKCGAVTKTIGVRTFLLCSMSDIKRKVEMVSENR